MLTLSSLIVPLLLSTFTTVLALPASVPSNFLLVTTSQSTRASNSSSLQNVSATSVFAPYYQPNLFLRLIDPGYGSLPYFDLCNGTLHTVQSGPHGIGTFEYNSTTVVAGQNLQFLAEPQPRGNVGLYRGYLVTVDGQRRGWTICNGDFGQRVILWKGTDPSCTPTYLQAVTQAPY